MIVLKIGVRSVFTGSNCSGTAPELFYASLVFVTLSIVAWALIILGYLIPMIFVAVLLSRNDYFPNGVTGGRGRIGGFAGGVFPNTNTNPAHPGCVEKLRVILLAEFPDSYQKECCVSLCHDLIFPVNLNTNDLEVAFTKHPSKPYQICMMEYKDSEVIVTTPCEHVFHKHCCHEWFQLARTCPVCRADVPVALGNRDHSRIESQHRRVENPQGISQNPEGIIEIELLMGR